MTQTTNAPNLRKEFQGQKNEKQECQKQNRETVTKSMADKLENQRETPVASYEPMPPGGAEKTANYQQAMIKREQRIKYIKERMSQSQERMRQNFGQSK